MGKKLKNLIGQTFGRLTVIKENGRNKQGYVIWTCKCSCGNYVNVASHNLLSGNTQSCKCLHKEKLSTTERKRNDNFIHTKFNNLLNQTFGELTVLKKTEKRYRSYIVWLCKCSCGNYVEVPSCKLVSGQVKSCGHLRRKKKSVENHSMSKTPLYHVWTSMKQRCQNPKSIQYKYYGLLGVSICEEWNESFIKFYNWSFQNGYKKGLTIDRINPYGNYEPRNCRWVTQAEQNKNKRDSKIKCKPETNRE